MHQFEFADPVIAKFEPKRPEFFKNACNKCFVLEHSYVAFTIKI